MKTNNSLLKRLRITKNGKVLSRKAGKNHFNAKESRSKQLNKKAMATFHIGKGELAGYLPHNI